MKIIKFAVLFTTAIALICLSYPNTELVHFKIPLGPNYVVPLIALLLISTIIGIVLGIFAMLIHILRLKRELKQARKLLKESQQNLNNI